MTLKSVQTEIEAFNARRAELAAKHKAEEDVLRERASACARIQAPLDRMLTERANLIERIETGRKQLAKQGPLQAAWIEIVDKAVGQAEAMHLLNFLHLWKAYPAEGNAERIAREIEAFLTRRQAELGNLEAELKAYAAQHGLTGQLPSELAQ
jgi:hypothetical protein